MSTAVGIILVSIIAALAGYAWRLRVAARRAEAASQAAITRETQRHEVAAADVRLEADVTRAVEVRAEGEQARPVDLFNEIGRVK